MLVTLKKMSDTNNINLPSFASIWLSLCSESW